MADSVWSLVIAVCNGEYERAVVLLEDDRTYEVVTPSGLHIAECAAYNGYYKILDRIFDSKKVRPTITHECVMRMCRVRSIAGDIYALNCIYDKGYLRGSTQEELDIIAWMWSDPIGAAFLNMRGLSLRMRLACGRTPLHVAAYSCNAAAVRELLRLGADITERDDAGLSVWQTALRTPNKERPYQCTNFTYDTVRMLLQHGARTVQPAITGDVVFDALCVCVGMSDTAARAQAAEVLSAHGDELLLRHVSMLLGMIGDYDIIKEVQQLVPLERDHIVAGALENGHTELATRLLSKWGIAKDRDSRWCFAVPLIMARQTSLLYTLYAGSDEMYKYDVYLIIGLSLQCNNRALYDYILRGAPAYDAYLKDAASALRHGNGDLAHHCCDLAEAYCRKNGLEFALLPGVDEVVSTAVANNDISLLTRCTEQGVVLSGQYGDKTLIEYAAEAEAYEAMHFLHTYACDTKEKICIDLSRISAYTPEACYRLADYGYVTEALLLEIACRQPSIWAEKVCALLARRGGVGTASKAAIDAIEHARFRSYVTACVRGEDT